VRRASTGITLNKCILKSSKLVTVDHSGRRGARSRRQPPPPPPSTSARHCRHHRHHPRAPATAATTATIHERPPLPPPPPPTLPIGFQVAFHSAAANGHQPREPATVATNNQLPYWPRDQSGQSTWPRSLSAGQNGQIGQVEKTNLFEAAALEFRVAKPGGRRILNPSAAAPSHRPPLRSRFRPTSGGAPEK
jgi:hypothetical protein